MFTKVFRSMSLAKQISFLAIFVALSVAVNSVIEIDVGGTNKITFSYFVCFFAGFLLGPLPGFIVGFLGDLIGFLIRPVMVYWFFGVTIGLFGFFSGLIMNGIRKEGTGWLYGKAAISFAVCFLLITCVINSIINYYYVYLFIWDGVFKKAFWVYFAGRIGFQSIVYLVNVALCFIALPFSVKIKTFRDLV